MRVGELSLCSREQPVGWGGGVQGNVPVPQAFLLL